MIFRRLYHDGLAQASYLIACEATRAAIVVDPVRDVTPYLEAAAFEEVRIAYVSETHLHADFLSGAEALSRACGATLLLSAEADDASAIARRERACAEPLRHGSTIRVGRVRLDVRFSPGHTPEHLTFLVTDEAIGQLPVGLLTGDLLFAGDVGRPDLLERAVGVKGSMRHSAAELHRSLRALRELPEFLQIWPGHGAGSACGRSLGAVPQTTLGYELRTNWAFQIADEETFIDEVLREQPEPPAYFKRMKALNARGAPRMPLVERSAREAVLRAVSRGALVVDTRPAKEFVASHAPGSVSIPAGHSFLHWAGALLDPERDVVLIASDVHAPDAAAERRDLALIGFDRVLGALPPSAIATISPSGAESVRCVQAGEFDAESASATVVDVRDRVEWNAGHIPGAMHVPLARIAEHFEELRDAGPLVIHCQWGARSVIAASVLRAAGIFDVANLEGGYAAWLRGDSSTNVTTP